MKRLLAINQPGNHLGLREVDRFVAHCHARGIDGERLFARKDMTLPSS
ncbi:hypothetical protein ABFU84_09940 [Xanthomonas translucens pv. undulosa]